MDDRKKVRGYLKEQKLDDNEYAEDALHNLSANIHTEKLINYYLHEEQDQDTVLEIFIRTNSGGVPLSYSDLLMSISTANWKSKDARKEIGDLVSEIRKIGRPSFNIDKDFVLKACLVLISDDIKFKLNNFSADGVRKFEENWERIRASVIVAFQLFEKLGFNDQTFRAKNATIPVIYYIYKFGLEDEIVRAVYDDDDKKRIQKWLTLSFVRSIFGAQSDAVLVTIRKAINEQTVAEFPINQIAKAFKDNPTRNYTLEDDFIDSLLKSQYGTLDADYALILLYPDLDYYNQDFHRDHMHPASFFRDEVKVKSAVPVADFEFFIDKDNWNSVLNLQLLNGDMNKSKQDKTLCDWVAKRAINRSTLYVEDDVSLDIRDFKNFIENRKYNLRNKLKSSLCFTV